MQQCIVDVELCNHDRTPDPTTELNQYYRTCTKNIARSSTIRSDVYDGLRLRTPCKTISIKIAMSEALCSAIALLRLQ
ncbi:MAG: hypothetical protein HC903_20885 [Methylacidiphilales bacterium]|nr:hypothetical protein [Candidatus Methylacidiphilales bacterium]NJR16268.1 hypothetical protein [Calothrix sp. CSU_2_0]